MAFEARYEAEHGILNMEVKGLFTSDDAREFNSVAKDFLSGHDYRQISVNLADAGEFAGTEARRATARNLESLGVTHLAMYNARPAIRIMGKILVKLSGGDVDSNFLKTKDEAIAWLKERRDA